MRMGIGSAVIVLIIALVSLGFLLSDNIDTHQELNVTSQKAGKLEKENLTLQKQLNTAITDNESLKTHNAELEQQILAWQEQARQLEEWKRILEEQVITLNQQRQAAENENAALKEQILTIRSANTNETEPLKKTLNPYSLALIVPFLPVAIGATYVVTRQTTKSSNQKNQRTRLDITQQGNMVRLSDNEMKEIIKIRRG